MAPDETDASPRETGQQPPSEHGDSGEWEAIDAYCGRTPSSHENDWTISSISRRFAHGDRAAEIVESPTGKPVTRDGPHWYVTGRRDRFPQTKSVTAEYDHYVFPDATDLTVWFEADEDSDQ